MASLPAPGSNCLNEGYRGAASNAPTPEGWQYNKALIKQLYITQDNPLKVVRQEMEARNFVATERMFKQRLKEWGFDQKKVKAAEWRHMLRLTQERRIQGKESSFIVNGKPINWSHIRKHLKRKKKTEDEFLAGGPEFEGVEDGSFRCFTPTETTPSQNGTASELAPSHRSPFSPQSPQTHLGPLDYSSPSYYPYRHQPCSPNHLPPAPSPFSPFAPFADTHRRPSMMIDPQEVNEVEEYPDIRLQNFALHWIKPSTKDEKPFDNDTLLKISGLLTGTAGPGDKGPDFSAILGLANMKIRPANTLPTEDELASQWILSYFQACIAARQGDVHAKAHNMEQGAWTFKTMIKHQNAYLLSGLTFMISNLYYHDHHELCIEFLEASCQIIEEHQSATPLTVPYQYMLASIKPGDLTVGWQKDMEEKLSRAYDQFGVLWKGSHCNTLSALYYWGFCLAECRRFVDAERTLRSCLMRSEEHLGASHILTIWCAATLARTLRDSGAKRGREAIQLQEMALDRCAALMPQLHPYYLELLRQCAELYSGVGDVKMAEKLYTTVLQGREFILGSQSPSTVSTLDSLESIIRQQGRDTLSNPAVRAVKHGGTQVRDRSWAVSL